MLGRSVIYYERSEASFEMYFQLSFVEIFLGKRQAHTGAKTQTCPAQKQSENDNRLMTLPHFLNFQISWKIMKISKYLMLT